MKNILIKTHLLIIIIGILLVSCKSGSSSNNNPEVIPGTIKLNPESMILNLMESKPLSITLENSQNVAQIKVELSSSNSKINMSSESCLLSTTNNTCNIVITANDESGTTTINTVANDYPNQAIEINILPIWLKLGNTYIPNSNKITSVALDINDIVYAGGNMINDQAAVWKYDNGTWSIVGNNNIPRATQITAITLDQNNNLYASGECTDIATETVLGGCVYRYDGNNWLSLGDDLHNSSSIINTITLDSNNVLYAGGNMSSGGSNVWQYNNTSWNAVTNESIPNSANLKSIKIDSNNNIYAGGIISSHQATVWKYDNSSWSILGGASIAGYGYINSIILNNNGVYAAGFTSGNANIWEILSNSITSIHEINESTFTTATDLIKTNSNTLYVSYQQITMESQSSFVEMYNGTNWDYVGNQVIENGLLANSIAIDSNNNIYIGCGSESNQGSVWIYKH